MRKIILILLAATSIANYCCGQDKAEKDNANLQGQVFFGPLFGANFSNVYGVKNPGFQATSKIGIVSGFFLSIPLSNYFAIQPEILFSQKGFRATGVLFDNPYDITRTESYIDLPILLAYKPLKILTILAGPEYSYLVQQDDEFANDFNSLQQEQEFKNDHSRKNTLGVLTGCDVNLKDIIISGRVGWDLQNNNGNGSSALPLYKNTWYQATIAYRFHL